MSNGGWNTIVESSLVCLSGAAEPGTSGKQPDRLYPSRRCANGASGALAATASRGRFLKPIGHRRHALKNPVYEVSLPQPLTAAHASVG